MQWLKGYIVGCVGVCMLRVRGVVLVRGGRRSEGGVRWDGGVGLICGLWEECVLGGMLWLWLRDGECGGGWRVEEEGGRRGLGGAAARCGVCLTGYALDVTCDCELVWGDAEGCGRLP